jgi:hypothetical protein
MVSAIPPGNSLCRIFGRQGEVAAGYFGPGHGRFLALTQVAIRERYHYPRDIRRLQSCLPHNGVGLAGLGLAYVQVEGPHGERVASGSKRESSTFLFSQRKAAPSS